MFDLHPSLHKHFMQSWESFTQFCENLTIQNLNSKQILWFNGEGVLKLQSQYSQEKYYLFSINDRLYGTRLVSDSITSEVFDFKGVTEFDNDLLTLQNLKTNGNYYKRLEASIDVDCKPYDYGKEHRLLISKANKVDLLYSQQLNEEESGFILKAQTYPSLKQAVEWQKKVNAINEKTAKILASKKSTA